MVISFLWRPRKAPEEWVSLSPPKHLQIQRPRDVRHHRAGQDRAQSCQIQTSTWPRGLPRTGQHLSSALSPERAWTQLCSVPHDSCPSGFCPVSSCISRIFQDRAARSRCQVNLRHCQEQVLFPPPPLIDLVLFVLLLFI